MGYNESPNQKSQLLWPNKNTEAHKINHFNNEPNGP